MDCTEPPDVPPIGGSNCTKVRKMNRLPATAALQKHTSYETRLAVQALTKRESGIRGQAVKERHASADAHAHEYALPLLSLQSRKPSSSGKTERRPARNPRGTPRTGYMARRAAQDPVD